MGVLTHHQKARLALVKTLGETGDPERPVMGYYSVTIKLEGTYQNNYPGAAMYANGYIANAAEEAVDKFESCILNGKVTIKRVKVSQEVEHEPAPGAVA